MNALDTEDLKEIRREYLRAAMAYLMFLKDKRDGNIKARGCCNGRIQCNYMTKE